MRFQIEQKGVKITHQISERVPDQISSDQKRLKQVLFNLLGNANKFTFEGQISVNVDYKPFSNRLIFKIKDTGVGIHKEDLNKLFKFFGTLASTKNINKGGMGLGLTISKMIIQQLGGEVTVKSEPSVGTEFEFWIPLHQEGLGGFKELDQLSPERILNQKFSFHSKRHSMRDDANNKTGLIMRRATKQIKKQSFLELPSELNVVQITAKSEVSDVINFTDLSNPLEGGDNIPHFSHGIHDKYQLLKEQTCLIPPVFINSTAQLQAHRLKEQSSTLLTFKQQTQSSRQFTSQKHTLRILCVDDSTYNLFVLQELLIVYATDACHIEVDTAISGQLALGKVKECLQQEGKAAHMYDLILLDLHMPIMDGFQTAEEIRQLIASNERWVNKTRNLHIIAVSAITRQQFMQSDQADIFDDFLEKPINIEALRKYLSTYEENRTAEGFW
ncbi:hypothetical protein FGO68_gene14236 [Halteria grandinella]|uniref:Histidine kinase n=1 Tax=Halteria grandinella TaxID=5974 RepID=A0A8J8P214_HALGN|nr:hypothetical protein FGO68_gene14236 [Halteria grandinella]